MREQEKHKDRLEEEEEEEDGEIQFRRIDLNPSAQGFEPKYITHNRGKHVSNRTFFKKF
jgi:23S rRNA maturation-related 3'-5' exoribonuclease YhaM